ncbi:Lethal(2)neighbour of Tid protein [Phyllosticta citricarpa]|uniref:Dol-P-Man:Man(5)GlcNAc(2)-PP-Dol alpha-1,3-mannosyltransferase n=1 Tax=Phyllosticta paracitricarpa TaxID=2016321 RepID=A0ABR1N1V7_9PEZI
MDLVKKALDISSDPRNARWLCPLLLCADALLCGLIIWKIPYTEIDWKAYMEQVEQYIDGERDYTKIKGGTGPLVYPGAHVYVYRLLYSLTGQGQNILTAQVLFAALYVAVLVVVMACYRKAKVPPYVFPMLILSKRLHSIFVLRCFNDCFAVGAFFLAVYFYQKHLWTAGSVFYSLAVGIKMSALLALPSLGLVLLQGVGVDRALTQAMIMVYLQLVFAYPFMQTNLKGYFSRAFELTRVFLYKWTVNWRFVSEETFLSREFAVALLAAHLALLVYFAATRWIKPAQRSVSDTIRLILKEPADQRLISRRVNPQFILTTMLSAIGIGMLCARSLHYQFFAWIAWATPFLLWRAGFHPILQYVIWGAQEWAWNVYPSTNASSMVVVAVLFVQIAGVWLGTRTDVGDKEGHAVHPHAE